MINSWQRAVQNGTNGKLLVEFYRRAHLVGGGCRGRSASVGTVLGAEIRLDFATVRVVRSDWAAFHGLLRIVWRKPDQRDTNCCIFVFSLPRATERSRRRSSCRLAVASAQSVTTISTVPCCSSVITSSASCAWAPGSIGSKRVRCAGPRSWTIRPIGMERPRSSCSSTRNKKNPSRLDLDECHLVFLFDDSVFFVNACWDDDDECESACIKCAQPTVRLFFWHVEYVIWLEAQNLQLLACERTRVRLRKG